MMRNEDAERRYAQIEGERDYYKQLAESRSKERDAAHNRIAELEEREQALAAHVEKLNEYAKSCADESAALIDKHNVQSDLDGSWIYDHQTPFELMQVVLSTPENNLARRDLIKQAEALEEAANTFDEQGEFVGYGNQLRETAADLRQRAQALK